MTLNLNSIRIDTNDVKSFEIMCMGIKNEHFFFINERRICGTLELALTETITGFHCHKNYKCIRSYFKTYFELSCACPFHLEQKMMWKKEKMLLTSIIFFSNNIPNALLFRDFNKVYVDG